MEWSFRKTISRVGFAYFILMAVSLAGQFLLTRFPFFHNGELAAWLLTDLPIYCMALPVFALVMHFIPSYGPPSEDTPPLSPVRAVMVMLFCLGCTYCFNLISGLLAAGISVIKGAEVLNGLEEVVESSNIWLNFLFGCVIAPVGEELLFRKWLYDKIAIFGDWCYVLIGGLIFGLYHANLLQLLYAFALGGIFCYLYAKTGRIHYTIILHTCINFFGLILGPYFATSEGSMVMLGIFTLTCMVFFVVTSIRTFHHLSFTPSACPMPNKPLLSAVTAPGMALYLLLCAALIIIATFLI